MRSWTRPLLGLLALGALATGLLRSPVRMQPRQIAPPTPPDTFLRLEARPVDFAAAESLLAREGILERPRIAHAGDAWNATDCLLGDSLPTARDAGSLVGRDRTILQIERGGIGYHVQVLWIAKDPPRVRKACVTWEPIASPADLLRHADTCTPAEAFPEASVVPAAPRPPPP